MQINCLVDKEKSEISRVHQTVFCKIFVGVKLCQGQIFIVRLLEYCLVYILSKNVQDL